MIKFNYRIFYKYIDYKLYNFVKKVLIPLIFWFLLFKWEDGIIIDLFSNLFLKLNYQII